MTLSKSLLVFFCLTLLVHFASAGERGPGTYCGVAVFDRWDACTLYSGIYVMYVSERVKEKLRMHAGKALAVDAKKVSQPINPGDGLISDLAVLGAAPPPRNWITISGLTLRASPDFKDGEKPSIVIALANSGKKNVKIFGSELAPTLLAKGKHLVPDGPSYALVTRQAFISGGSEPRTSGRGLSEDGPYTWKIDKAVPISFTLKPGEERRVRITFDLPKGEYDFLAGYAGGVHQERALASNLVAFDVADKGSGKLVMAKRR